MMPLGTPAKSPALPCTLTSMHCVRRLYSFQGSQIKLVKVSRPRCDVLVVRRCVLRPKKELKALQYLKKWLRCPILVIRRSPAGVRWARDLTCLPKRWEPGTTWRAPFSLDQLLWGTHSCLSISMFSFKSQKNDTNWCLVSKVFRNKQSSFLWPGDLNLAVSICKETIYQKSDFYLKNWPIAA